MKIRKVIPNNRKKAFEVHTYGKTYLFPYAVVRPTSTKENKVIDTYVDKELGHEGFVYVLASGEEGTVHIDHVLEYNKDPSYMADMFLYKLTLWAQEAVKKSPLSTREIIRRLRTSPTQYYRLLDQTKYNKSVRQLITLLHIVDYEVEVVLKGPSTQSTPRRGGSELPLMVIHGCRRYND